MLLWSGVEWLQVAVWSYDWHTWHCSHFLPTIIPPAERGIATSRSHLTSPRQPIRASPCGHLTRRGPMRAQDWPYSCWSGLSLPMLTLYIVITRGLRPWGSLYQVLIIFHTKHSLFILHVSLSRYLQTLYYSVLKLKGKKTEKHQIKSNLWRIEMFLRVPSFGGRKLWPPSLPSQPIKHQNTCWLIHSGNPDSQWACWYPDQ